MDRTRDILTIYTDGACSGNPGPGGWAAVLIWKGTTKQISGFEKDTTNNRMELKAAIEALKAVKRSVPIEVYTDSKYLQMGITVWIVNWKRKSWSKVANVDLWKELDSVVSGKAIKWFWVEGHSGDYYNTIVDELARAEVTKNKF